MSQPTYIFHIATQQDVNNFRQTDLYTCSSLDNEGFIHCCDADQLAGVVSRYYQGVDDVQLMTIDPDKLEVALIRENTVGGAELFPHLYGPINKAAVVDIVPFGVNATQRTGLFE